MAAAYVDVHLHLIFRHDSTRPRHTAARAGGAPCEHRQACDAGLHSAPCPREPNRSNPAATHVQHRAGRVPACSRARRLARKRGTARARRTHLGPQETRKEV
jgi:hypothetical protein